MLQRFIRLLAVALFLAGGLATAIAGPIINSYIYAVPLGPMTLAYQTASLDTGNASSYSFSSQAIGTAASERIVIVCASTGNNSTTNVTIDAVTVGGISATQRVQASNAASRAARAEIWTAPVPTGTTATIDLTLSGTVQQASIGVWSLTGSYSSVVPINSSTNGRTSGALALSLNVTAGDVLVGCGQVTRASSTLSFTWAGITEQYDTAEGSVGAASGGDFTTVSTESPRTVTGTISSTYTDAAGVVGAWR